MKVLVATIRHQSEKTSKNTVRGLRLSHIFFHILSVLLRKCVLLLPDGDLESLCSLPDGNIVREGNRE